MSLVYSTDKGRLCPNCGRPVADCACKAGASAAVPNRVTARLRIEKQGRGGKIVTVVDGLPDNADFLRTLSQHLKKACGVGGTAGEGRVELQGDQRDRIRDLLKAKGYTVKG